MKLAIDHLVIAAPDLESGANHVADLLGVAPQGGGVHPRMGTHNRVMGMFGGMYLRSDRDRPGRPGAGAAALVPALDSEAVRQRLADGPFLAHWAARVERPVDLSRWQAQYPDRIAPAIPMTRGALHWRLTVPDDGSLPAWPGEATHAGDGLFPTLIQWDVPNHPAVSLPRQDLALRRLHGSHPQAKLLRQGLAWIGAADLIEIEQTDGPPLLVAEIDTPAGTKTLR